MLVLIVLVVLTAIGAIYIRLFRQYLCIVIDNQSGGRFRNIRRRKHGGVLCLYIFVSLFKNPPDPSFFLQLNIFRSLWYTFWLGIIFWTILFVGLLAFWLLFLLSQFLLIIQQNYGWLSLLLANDSFFSFYTQNI